MILLGQLVCSYLMLFYGRLSVITSIDANDNRNSYSFRYILLDKIWPVVSLKFVSLKVGLDQFLLAPILINIYLFFNEILQGKGFEGYKKRFEQEYWNTVTNCWKLWIPVQVNRHFFISCTVTAHLSYFLALGILHLDKIQSRI